MRVALYIYTYVLSVISKNNDQSLGKEIMHIMRRDALQYFESNYKNYKLYYRMNKKKDDKRSTMMKKKSSSGSGNGS